MFALRLLVNVSGENSSQVALTLLEVLCSNRLVAQVGIMPKELPRQLVFVDFQSDFLCELIDIFQSQGIDSIALFSITTTYEGESFELLSQVSYSVLREFGRVLESTAMVLNVFDESVQEFLTLLALNHEQFTQNFRERVRLLLAHLLDMIHSLKLESVNVEFKRLYEVWRSGWKRDLSYHYSLHAQGTGKRSGKDRIIEYHFSAVEIESELFCRLLVELREIKDLLRI